MSYDPTTRDQCDLNLILRLDSNLRISFPPASFSDTFRDQKSFLGSLQKFSVPLLHLTSQCMQCYVVGYEISGWRMWVDEPWGDEHTIEYEDEMRLGARRLGLKEKKEKNCSKCYSVGLISSGFGREISPRQKKEERTRERERERERDKIMKDIRASSTQHTHEW